VVRLGVPLLDEYLEFLAAEPVNLNEAPSGGFY
jgi:hypothetical protein